MAGCGGSATPSVLQLRARATRICSLASLDAERISTPRTESGGQAFLKNGIAVIGPELRRLRALGAPKDVAEVYGAAVADLGAELAAIRRTIHALAQQQDPVIAFKALQQRLAPLESQATDDWQALEVPACVNG